MGKMTFGKWLRDQRRVRDVTQSELSAKANLAYGQVSKYERGVLKLPTEDVRDRIHAVLGTSDDDLVDAGVLRWLHVGERSIMVPADGDDPTPVVDGVVPFGDVVNQITEAARGMQWTPNMLETVLLQIRQLHKMQSGTTE